METQPDHRLTIDDFTCYDWQAVLTSTGATNCVAYSRAFYSRQKELDGVDTVGEKVYEFLALVTSGYVDLKFPDSPFRPIWVDPQGRTTIPDDLPRDDLALLPLLVPMTTDSEMRARLADVGWQRNRNYRLALAAVEAYVATALKLEQRGDWLEALKRFERALQLIAPLRRAHTIVVNSVVNEMENVLIRVIPKGKRQLQPARYMNLLQDYGLGDSELWSVYSAELAMLAEQQGALDQAQDYWDTTARWHRLLKDDESTVRAEAHAAEVQVKIADSYLAKPEPDHLSSSIQLEMAVQRFRRAGLSRRAEELHQELIDRQGYSFKQMKSFGESIDISRFVRAAEAAVRGKPFNVAVALLAGIDNPSTFESLRSYVKEISEDLSFIHLLSNHQRVDHAGRVVANKPSLTSTDPDERDRAIQAEMFEHAALLRRVKAQATIAPARRQIYREHPVRQDDLLPFVKGNLFIPQGHEDLVLRGLHAGFVGDLTLAVHLLVPQLENSLRHALNMNGVVTSGLTEDGVQGQRDLGWLLRQPETIELFGEDLVFDLRGLLSEKLGTNFRNLLAHGLLSHWETQDLPAEYVWWVALRFYCLPILVRLPPDWSGTHRAADQKQLSSGRRRRRVRLQEFRRQRRKRRSRKNPGNLGFKGNQLP